MLTGLAALLGSGAFICAEELDEGVYRIQDKGSLQLYEIDWSSVKAAPGKGKLGVKALQEKPEDFKSFKKQYRETAAGAAVKPGIVFYPKGYDRKSANGRVLYNKLILQLPLGADAQQISDALGARSFREYPAKKCLYLVVQFEDAIEALEKLELTKDFPQITSAKPLLSKNVKTMATPTDPRFAYSAFNTKYQWHLWNTGQNDGVLGEDINVRDAWDKYTGAGVTIAVADDGLDIKHPDLIANTTDQVHYNWASQTNDPTPVDGFDESHGTSVGGVAAARWNNGEGGTGSAPEASLVGLRWLVTSVPGYFPGGDITAEVLGWGQTFGDRLGATNIDVHNNSWGPVDPVQLSAMDGLEEAAILAGIEQGRGGLGTIYMFAAGNDRLDNGNANHTGYCASRYTIAIGGTRDQGVNASYSNPGCALIVSTPTGDFGFQDITTTQFRGVPGGSDGYTDSFNGTSSATPLATGVVALMLEANPGLGWRDVQEILIQSARKNDAFDLDWQENTAGFHFNHRYGAGVIDATAAVNLAETWVNLEPETSVSLQQADLGLDIPDQGVLELEFDFAEVANKRVENIEVQLKVEHVRRADLECVLVSPSGMRSRLKESFAGGFYADIDYTFLSTFCWGEDSHGTWRVEFNDRQAGVGGTVEDVKITIYGVDRIPQIPPIAGPNRVGNVVNTPMDYTLDVRYADTVDLMTPLPPGLFYDAENQRIYGTPTEIGMTQVHFLLKNEYGETDYLLAIYIGDIPDQDLAGAIEQHEKSVKSTGFYGMWDLELDDTSDGSDAIKTVIDIPFSPTGNPVSPYGEAHLTVPHSGGGIVMFNWKVDSPEALDRLWFYPSSKKLGLRNWRGFLSGDRDWGAFASKVPDGNIDLKWSYMEDKTVDGLGGGGKALLDQVQLFTEQEYSTMLADYAGTDLEFETDARALWVPAPYLFSPDGKVLQPSAIGNAQYADLTTRFEGPVRITFDWALSAQNGDKLQFLVDGVRHAELNGDQDWSEYSFVADTGSHVVTWRYVKDSRGSRLQDTAFLDSISYEAVYTYTFWADNIFTDAQLLDPAISGEEADPNNNGISNLLEYAFGGNPLEIGDTLSLPALVMDGLGHGFTYRKDTKLADITYIMEETTDLENWTPVTGDLISTDGDYETYRYELTPSDTDTERFVRVRVVK